LLGYSKSVAKQTKGRGQGAKKPRRKPVEAAPPVQETGFERIGPGEHLCGFYSDKEEEYSIVVPFFRAGLQNKEKCIWILDESTEEEAIQAFRRMNIDLEKHLASKQFVLLSGQETYLKGGYFDPDRMVEILKQNEKRAIEEGYLGLRVSGEMTWDLRKQPGAEKLVEYEAKLNYFLPGSKTSAICLYNEKKFPPKTLLNIIYTHPRIIIHGSLYENQFYMPPDDFLSMMGGEITRDLVEKVKSNIIQRAEREREHRQAEEKLRESEEKYRSLVEYSADSVYMLDGDLRYLSANGELLRRLNLPREKVLGRTFAELHTAEETQEFTAKVREVFETGRAVQQEHYSQRLGRFFLRTISPIKDDKTGAVKAVTVVGKDITEIKKMMENLRKSEMEYRSLAENISDILLRIDLEGNCTYISKNVEEETGYTLEEVMKMNIRDILTPDSYKTARDRIKMWKEGAKSLPPYTVDVRVKDGRIIPFELKTSPIFENGELRGIQIVARDITERTKAMQLLQQARAYAEAIVETVHEPLVVLDADMRVISANRAFYECFKVSPEETERYSLYDLGNRQWDIPELRKLLNDVAEKNISFKEYVVVHDFPVIGKRIMLLNARQMRTKANGEPMVLLAIEDITERQQMESQLRRSNDIQTAIVSLLSIPLTFPLEEILKRALKIILSISWLGFESRGSIFLFDEEQNVLVMKAQSGMPETIQKSCATVPVGTCLCGKAAAAKKIIFADHVDENHQTRYEGITPHGHYCVPILSDDKSVGVLSIYLKEGHRQEETEEEFLRATANALALIITRKNFEKRQLEFIYKTNEISHGECYLHRSHRAAYHVTSQLMLLGVPGLCFTREAPEKLADYGIPRKDIILLSSVPLKGFETIDSLQNISMRISEFIKNNRDSIVLLDGLEYLMSRFGFDMIYKFLQEKRFNFIESGAVFLLPVDLGIFTDKERALLASEIKIIG